MRLESENDILTQTSKIGQIIVGSMIVIPCPFYMFCRYNLGFVRWWTARIEQVPDACLYGWCKLFLRELNKQMYYYVLMFQIIRVLAHTLLIFITLM